VEIWRRISLGTARYVPSQLISRFRQLTVFSHATNESLRLQLKSRNLMAIIPNGLYSKNKTHVPEVTQSRILAVLQSLRSVPLFPSFCSKCQLIPDRHNQLHVQSTQPEINAFGSYAVSTADVSKTIQHS